ncbi:MAG: PAS domain S-box protein [Lutibacter sp.]
MSLQLKYIQDTLAFISEKGYEANNAKFLKSTAVFLAELFDVNYVLIDKYTPKTPTTVETVAFYANGSFLPNIVYKLLNTPCDTIINKKFCSYPANVKNIFPKDDFLAQKHIESYIGKPLWNSKKEAIGLIAFMDTKQKNEKEINNIAIVLDIIAIKIEEVLEKMLFENQLNLKIKSIKIAKEIAKNTEDKYKKLSNLIFEGIIIAEEDSVVLECNNIFLKMFGYSSKEIIGKSIIQLLFPEKYHEQIRANRNKNHTLPFEIEGIKKDGTIFPVEVEARNIDLGNAKFSRLVAFRDLTLRKKEQFENKKLSIAIEQSANTVVITDIFGNIEYTNPKFTEITGYTAAEVLGKNPRIINSGAQPKEFYANLWQTITKGNIWSGQMKNKTKSGKFYWEQVTITPIKDENGNNLSYLAIKEDITHRKIAEDNLKESEEKYRYLFENNPQPMWIYDLETLAFLEVNYAAIKHYGYSREEFLSMTIKDIRPKDDIDALLKDIEIAKRIGYNPAGEWLHIKKSGEIINISIVSNNVTFNNREARHVLVNDITSTKKAEKELLIATEEIAKSEKKFRELFEKSGDAILIMKNGVFVDCNQATINLLGYKNYEDVLNRKPSEISPKFQPDGLNSSKKAEAFLKIAIEKGTYRFEWWHKKQNSDIFPVEVLLTTIENEPNNKTIHCVWRDITDRKQAEEQLQKQNDAYKLLSEDYLSQNTALIQLSNELSEKNRLLLQSKDRFINLFEQNPVPLWEQDFSAVIKLLKDKKPKKIDLKTFLDKNPDFVKDCISNIKILNVNKAALELFGVKNVEELKGHLKKTNNKKALEVLKKELVSIGSNKKTFSDETEFTGKDGLPVLALIKSVIIDDYGTSIASVIDVTAERNAANELTEQKLLFEKMFNAIQDSIIITNTNREIVMANPGVKNTLGYSQEELIGKSTEIFYADNSKFEKAGDKVFKEDSIKKEDDYITYYKTKENVVFPGETFGSKLFNNQGKWIGNIGVIRNIADRLNFINELQKAKEIAEKSENSLNEAQKIAQIGSYDLDFYMGVWKSSTALNNIFGIDEKYNRNVSDWLAIIHPEDILMMEQYIQKSIIENKEEFNKEYRIIRDSDKQIRWVHGLGKLELDHKGNLKKLIGTIQDISEKRQILHDLIISKEKAEESDRMKTEFIQNMSHEIRTPMNGILGFTDLLDNPDLSDEKRKIFIEIIKNSSHQLLHIIDDIMEISVLETKQIKAEDHPICLNDLLYELHTIFKLKATNKNIALVLKNELSNKESTILTDKNKLNKVLSNLLENALKFTNEGVVELGYKLNKDSEPANLEIFVKDSGIGIKPEKQKMIFDRFSQAEKALSKKVGGLGLGLSIAKENAALLGGEISVVSQLGEGAAFFVTIPYKPITLVTKIEKQVDYNKKYTILIAEDEEVNFMVLEILLEDKIKLPCTIIHAKDGLQAVEFCKNIPEIELVLMDIKMPKMDGHEATKQIKEFRPNLPIIAQTAFSSPEEKEKAFLSGCNDFIAKPISKDVLNSVINKYLLAL